MDGLDVVAYLPQPLLGQRVLAARKRRRLSRQGLADRAGLDYRTVFRIESGDTPNPGIFTLLRLQRALDLPSIELLIGGEEEFASLRMAPPAGDA